MADMMAIVSKAVFEKAAGKAASVGTRLGMDRYVSANKNLAKLEGGGKLYLVTVRPPDEALWLVAILDDPESDGAQWIAKPSTIPITDISALKDQLQFESGKGLSAAKGALGMSLQTPRGVTDEDVELLELAAGRRRGGEGDGDGLPAPPAGVVATGSGNRRELLLAGLLADPGNDGAHQVYADALVAANDPRGELILVDRALSGPLSIRRREQLAAKKRELLGAHGKTWFPYDALSRWRLHDGFIVSISGTLKAITGVAAKLFAAEPVTEVHVAGIVGTAGVKKLLASAWLPRVRHLVVRGELGDDGFAALIAAKQLANLTALNVSYTGVGPDGLAALAQHLPKCRSLVVTGNPVGDKGVAGITRWSQLGALEALYLGRCRLGAKGVANLLDGPPLTHLVKLALAKNELGNPAATTIAKRAAQLPALRVLDLRETGVGTPGAKTLLEGALAAVRRFDLRDNDVRITDPRVLA
jgi:hypothetical protein